MLNQSKEKCVPAQGGSVTLFVDPYIIIYSCFFKEKKEEEDSLHFPTRISTLIYLGYSVLAHKSQRAIVRSSRTICTHLGSVSFHGKEFENANGAELQRNPANVFVIQRYRSIFDKKLLSPKEVTVKMPGRPPYLPPSWGRGAWVGSFGI